MGGIHDSFFKEMSLLYPGGGGGTVDALGITSQCLPTAPSAPAQLPKIHIADSCGYAASHSAKATV